MLLLAGEERFVRSSRVVLEKSVALLGVVCVAVGVEFGVDAWRGRGGLLIHVLLGGLLLMLSTEKEFERYIGVVLKRDDEKLGLVGCGNKRDSYSCMGRDTKRHISPHPGPCL